MLCVSFDLPQAVAFANPEVAVTLEQSSVIASSLKKPRTEWTCEQLYWKAPQSELQLILKRNREFLWLSSHKHALWFGSVTSFPKFTPFVCYTLNPQVFKRLSLGLSSYKSSVRTACF